MTKLSYTLGMKVFACFIAVLSGITAFFDGIGIFLANSYDFYSSSLAELKLAHPYLDTGMLTKLYGMRGSLLPILVISLLLFAISVIYLLCAAGIGRIRMKSFRICRIKSLWICILPSSARFRWQFCSLFWKAAIPLPIRGRFPL